MKLLVLGLALISSLANAARLEGVSILEIKPEEGNIKIKIQAKDGPKDSYFFVDISKGDPEAFEKLVKAIKKAKHKNQYQLDLSILSFSLSPNGSYYKSEGVTFDLKGDREPDSIKSKKKDKKRNFNQDLHKVQHFSPDPQVAPKSFLLRSRNT